MQKVFLFSLLCWWAGVSLSHGQSFSLAEGHDVQYRGEVFTHQWYFPQAGISHQQADLISTLGAEVDLSYLTPWSLDFKLHPRLAVDPDDTQLERQGSIWMGDARSRFYFEEAYADWYHLEWMEIRAGYQIFNWKAVESYSWMDFINQTDQEVDLFSAEKLPELVVRGRWTLPIELEHSLSVFYIPIFQPGPQPRKNNRYDFGAGQGFEYQYLPDSISYRDSSKQYRPQVAIKWNSMLLESIDYSLVYFNGYERLGIPQPIAFDAEGHPTVISSHYEVVEKLGLNFVTELGSWLVKGEVLANQYYNPNLDSWLGWTVGAEYTLYSPLVEEQDLGLISEFIGHNASDETPLFLPFKNHVFLGLRYTFNNISDRSILLGGFLNYQKVENVLSLEYEERIGQDFKIKAGGFLLAGEETSELSTFESSSRFQTELSYFF